MASTFRIQSSAYQTRYLYVVCEQIKDIANNTSTINWTLTVAGGVDNNYSTGPTTLTINGVDVYYSPRKSWSTYEFPAVKGSVGGSIKVPHNNDGKATIQVSLSTAIYTSTVSTTTDTWTLDDIPRGAEIISVSQFYDDENPVITYTNPAGNNVSSLEIAMFDEDGATVIFPYRTITNKTGTSYTFVLSDDDRETLWHTLLKGTWQASPVFRLKTVLNGNTFYSDYTSAVEIRNNAPVIVGLNVEDIQEDTYALTGDRYKAIKGYNTIQVFVDAEPQKGATIMDTLITNGTITELDPTSVFINSTNPTFEIKVRDDRGAWTKQTYTMPMVDYFYPTCNLKTEADMVGETTARITLTITGKVFNSSFGAKDNVLTIQYAYQRNNENYTSWINTNNITISNGEYTATAFVDLDYKDSYTFRAAAFDLVATGGIISAAVPVRIIPVFDWSNEDFNFNVPISFNGQQMNDFVVDAGLFNGWHYRLWDSGLAECWRRLQITTPVNNAWGGLYTSGSLSNTNLTYPFDFVETPILTVSLMPFGSGGLVMATGSGYGSASQTGPFEIARGTSLSSGQFLLAYHAAGKWR